MLTSLRYRMEGPRFAAVLAALLLAAGCDGTGGGARDGTGDATDAATDGAPDGGGASKAIGLSACGPLGADDFCLLDPPYTGVWTGAPDDVWIIESDFQEVTARHFDGGRWTTFEVGSGPLAGIWGSGAGDVWAVGAAGAIQHWDGRAWAPTPSPTEADLKAVWGSGPRDVWAVGTTPGSPPTGVTLHFDGGAWSSVGCCDALPDPGQNLVAVSGSGPADVWAVGSSLPAAGADPAPLALHWDGVAWTPLAIAGTDFGLTSVASHDAADIWFGASRQILHYDGAAFTSTSILGTVADLWESAPGEVWGVGSGGAIYHWSSGVWTSLPSGTSNDLASVAASGSTDAWAVGPAGTVLDWNGDGWTPISDGTTGPLGAVAGTDVDDVWTSGPLHFDGDGWSHDPLGSSIAATGLCGFSSDDVWAAGAALSAGGGNGFLAHWDGRLWTIDGIDGVYVPITSAAPSLGPSSMNALWCHTPSDVWAVGQITAITGPVEATVAHWDGRLWSPIAVPSTQFLAGVWGSAADDIWAAGGVGTLLHWDGATWTAIATTVTDDLGAVWGSGPNDVWVAIAHAPQFLHWDGTLWTTVADGAGFGMAAIWGTGAADAWAVGGNASGSAVVHWDGAAWAAVWSVPAAIGKLTGLWGKGSSLFVVSTNGQIFLRP